MAVHRDIEGNEAMAANGGFGEIGDIDAFLQNHAPSPDARLA